MKLLLDTHIAIWMLTEPHRLGVEGRKIVGDDRNETIVSVVSLWEIAIKRALARPQVPPFTSTDALGFFLTAGFQLLTVSATHAVATEDLPLLHKDPFDRMLVAQATSENMRLLTSDAALFGYGPIILRI